jgi:hypothetical protein
VTDIYIEREGERNIYRQRGRNRMRERDRYLYIYIERERQRERERERRERRKEREREPGLELRTRKLIQTNPNKPQEITRSTAPAMSLASLSVL